MVYVVRTEPHVLYILNLVSKQLKPGVYKNFELLVMKYCNRLLSNSYKTLKSSAFPGGGGGGRREGELILPSKCSVIICLFYCNRRQWKNSMKKIVQNVPHRCQNVIGFYLGQRS
jgi:hypothetical protein